MAEHRALLTERVKLRDERRNLLHAHHAGAVPLDRLKEEQNRISRRLTFVDSRIDTGQDEYDQANHPFKFRDSDDGWIPLKKDPYCARD